MSGQEGRLGPSVQGPQVRAEEGRQEQAWDRLYPGWVE